MLFSRKNYRRPHRDIYGMPGRTTAGTVGAGVDGSRAVPGAIRPVSERMKYTVRALCQTDRFGVQERETEFGRHDDSVEGR